MSDITVPPAFLRDEPADRFAARIAALADRLERIEREFLPQMNDRGRWLVRRAAFAAWLDARPGARRVLAVDGDREAL